MAQEPKIILASGSPRRKMLLKNLGIDFTSVSPDVDESYDSGLAPEQGAQHIAQRKAGKVADCYPGSAVIAADTIVVVGGRILGKPADKRQAFDMLKTLSGSWHEVLTGICILYDNEKSLMCETTRVHFVELEDDFIQWYIGTNEPMDKAGSYGIQSLGSVLADRIEGDFYNIMGLPVARVVGELNRMNIYKMGRN